jgi:anti-sigma B factor antagonist
MTPLEIGVERRDGATVVSVGGEVDMATAPQLCACLRELSGPVIVDLSRVNFLDSSGMAVLVGARARADRTGGELRLRTPTEHVRRILELTGLSEWIEAD